MFNKNINISRLNKYKPAQLMIHSAHEKLSRNHINYWINILNKIDISFSILVRDIDSYKQLIRLYPKYQILYAKTPVDVEDILVKQSNLKSILYTTNLAKNIHLLRFNHLKHIFIGTKNSDQLSEINKSYRAYDEIYVSSQSQIDKYKNNIENLGHLKFHIVGKPQIKDIFFQTQDKSKTSNILYLPFDNIMQDIFFSIIKQGFRTKLMLNKNLEKIKNDIKNLSIDYDLKIDLFTDMAILDTIAINCDFIVTDINHISVWLLAYNIPIVLYVPNEVLVESLRLDIPLESLYIFSNLVEFESILLDLKIDDRLKDIREEQTEYLLGKNATLDNQFLKCLTVDD